MDHQTLSVSLLDGHAKNYLKHPPEQIKRLKASLERFDQVRSIVVRRAGDRYTVLAGHGIVEAARACKRQALRCDIVPDDWDDATAQAYLIADNAHAAAAQADNELLARLLQEDRDAGGLLESLGSSEKELSTLLLKVKNSHEVDFLQAYLDPPVQQTFPQMTGTTMTVAAPQTWGEVATSTTTTVETIGNAPTITTYPPVAPPLSLPQQPATIQYFPMTFAFTYEQRDIVLRAIKAAKEQLGADNSTDVLVTICAAYLEEPV